MMDFLLNYAGTILISGLLLAVVLGIVCSTVKKRKRGKSMVCSCGCGSCPGAALCHGQKEDIKQSEQ